MPILIVRNYDFAEFKQKSGVATLVSGVGRFYVLYFCFGLVN